MAHRRRAPRRPPPQQKKDGTGSADPPSYLSRMVEHHRDAGYRRKTTRAYLKKHPDAREQVESEAYALLSTAILSLASGHYDFYMLNTHAYHRLVRKALKWVEKRVGPPDPKRITDLDPLFDQLSPYLFHIAKRGVKRVFTSKVKDEFLQRIEHRYKRAKRKKDRELLERLVGGMLALYLDMKPKKNPFLITFIYFQLVRKIEREYHVEFDIPTP